MLFKYPDKTTNAYMFNQCNMSKELKDNQKIIHNHTIQIKPPRTQCLKLLSSKKTQNKTNIMVQNTNQTLIAPASS